MNGNGKVRQFVYLLPNTQYTLSCYAKVASSGQSVFLGITLIDSNTTIGKVTFTTTEYEKKSFTFSTGDAFAKYRVWFWHNKGGEYYYDDFSLSNDNTGIAKHLERTALVYPTSLKGNPLHIELPETHPLVTITIFNLNGLAIYTNTVQNTKNFTIDNEALPIIKGNYILELNCKKKLYAEVNTIT